MERKETRPIKYKELLGCTFGGDSKMCAILGCQAEAKLKNLGDTKNDGDSDLETRRSQVKRAAKADGCKKKL